MKNKGNFRIGTAVLLALSIFGIAPAATAGERGERYNYSYDRGDRDQGYRYHNDYRDNHNDYRDNRYGYRDEGYRYDDRRYDRAGRSVAVVGGSAAAGAVVGGIAGGGKGAAIGALIGGIGGLIIDKATDHHRNR